MRKHMTKILAALLLLSVFTACGDDASPVVTESSAAETETETAAETELADNLPDKDYGGSDVMIWGDVASFKYFYDSEKETGEVVNDAVYKRNQTVSERFNINLVYDLGNVDAWRDTSMNTVINSVMANDQAFDIVTGVSCYTSNAVVAGCFQNLNNFEYLDFSQPWWAADINKAGTIDDRLYMASGYFDMSSVAGVYVTFFSNEMAKRYVEDDLFEIVANGNWTFDMMLGYAKNASADLDGNSVFDEYDQYGLTSSWDVLAASYTASGHSFTTRTAEEISFNPLTEQVVEANDMMYNLMKEQYYYSGYTKGEKPNYDNRVNVFTDNRALFFMNEIGYASDSRLREMGDYGILPCPKFSETQEKYGSFTSAFVSCIPVDAPDSERSSIILEALNAESYKTVLPTYYDIALSNKYLNDTKSKEMLDLVFTNITCPFEYIYSAGPWLVQISIGQHENYTSWYESQLNKYNKALQKMLTKILAFEY